MKLEVHERVLLLNLLPKEGDYAALKTLRRAREMLSFTPEEVQFYDIKTVQGAEGPQVQWSTAKAAELVKDIPIDEWTTHTIRDILADLNKKKQLTDQHMSCYEKFVVMYQ